MQARLTQTFTALMTKLLPILALVVAVCTPAFAQDPASENSFWHSGFASGTDYYMDDILFYDQEMYAGGRFLVAGGTDVRYVARWDGQKWNKVGSGLGVAGMGLVHTMTKAPDGRIYAGGMFTDSGLFRIANIAMYVPEIDDWFELGTGTDRAVRSAVIGPDGALYIGGEFTTAGGVQSFAFARWDGTQWNSLAGSMHSRAVVRTIAVSGNDMYVGGFFNQAGGVAASNIARWDGNTFHPLGSGLDGYCTAITVANGKVYAGGDFLMAGGKTARGIAVWNGSTWNNVGSGLSVAGTLDVRSIIVDIDEIYVGGRFSHAGGLPAKNVAHWDGEQWNALGTGTNAQVKVLRERDGILYVGGDFTQAGDKESNHIAMWTKPGKNSVVFEGVWPDPKGTVVDIAWGFNTGNAVQGLNVYRRSPGEASSRLNDELLPPGTFDFQDLTVATGESYEYQLGVVRSDGSEIRSDFVAVTLVPTDLRLAQNVPNPFNPITTIRYELAAAAKVQLVVYNIRGERVRTLVNSRQTPGEYTATWDGTTDTGNSVATGVYVYRLQTPTRTIAKKMVLLK